MFLIYNYIMPRDNMQGLKLNLPKRLMPTFKKAGIKWFGILIIMAAAGQYFYHIILNPVNQTIGVVNAAAPEAA